MPVVANLLVSSIESRYAPQPIDEVPMADVAVVLGGILGQPVPPRVQPDLADPVDRVIEAWRLYRAGKIKAILIAGGNLPWATAIDPESVLIKRFLLELGVPDDAVWVETRSRNTRENAVNTVPILAEHNWDSVLLVTSAAHMPRAVATFARAGITVISVSTDLHAHYPIIESLLDLLPDAAALAETTSVLREYLGFVYYRARGWA